MISKHRLLDAFEIRLIRQTKADYHENLKIFTALYQEAIAVGALPPENLLDGIEVDIRLAKALNV